MFVQVYWCPRAKQKKIKMSLFNFNEDLTVFTAREFSSIAYVHSARVVQAPSQIQGIYSKRAESLFDLEAQKTEGRRITLLVQTSDTEYLRHEDQLSINGNNHSIVGINPTHDGQLTELVLKETELVPPVGDEELVDVEIDNIVAGEAVAQYRVVYRDPIDSKIYLADATVISRVFAIGAVEQNIAAEGTGTVRYAGYIKNTSWNFNPSAGLFLGSGGNFVQSPLVGAVAQVDLGTVISPTEILLDISDPIYL